MSFVLGQSVEQSMLAESLRRLAEKSSDFEKRRRRLSGDAPDRLALWALLAEVGALGAAFTEERGGLGGAPADIAAAVEALAPSLLAEPLIPVAVTAGQILAAAQGQRPEDLIAATVVGKRLPVVAHVEGFDPFGPPRLLARRSANGFVLDGVKPAVRGADVATDLLVSVRLEDDSTRVLLIDARQDGVRLERLRLIDAAGAADVRFERVEVPTDALLDFAAGATSAIANALDWTLASLCVETAALIAAANAATFSYLNIRQQFGQPLARFQALQHRAADMFIAQAEAEAVASDALTALSLPATTERSRRILLASLTSDGAGRLVGHEAIQLHGGMGVSDELIVSHIGRRLAAIRTQVASVDARQARILDITGRTQ